MYSLYNGRYDINSGTGIATFNDAMQNYWERSLFQRISVLVEFEGLPNGWDKDAFRYALYRMGYVTCFISKRYGRVFQPSTPCYMGINYQPTAFQITSPFFQFPRPLVRGTECEVIKLTPDYRGLWDIITKYASELTKQDVAIRQSQMNARFAYAGIAKDENSAKTLKTVFEKLGNGEEAIVIDKKLMRKIDDKTPTVPWEQFDRNLKSNFILPELLEGRRTIMTDFYREMGIRMNPDKKERLISSESEGYNMEAFARLAVYNDSLQDSLEQVNNFLDTNITARVRGYEGGEQSVTELFDITA